MRKIFSFLALQITLLLLLSASVQAAEVIYLTDTLESDDNKSALYIVDLVDGAPNQAVLTFLTDLTGFNHVDAIAATPNGEKIYMIDDGATSTKEFFVYDVASNTYGAGTLITGMGVLPSGNSMDHLVVASDGTVYLTNNSDQSLYTIDPNTAVASLIGQIRKDNNNALLSIIGGDLAFNDAGELFMWTNWQALDAPRGLYKLALPGGIGDVIAAFQGPASSRLFYTGLGVRDNGAGDLIGSENTLDNVNVLNADGTVSTSYRMILDGALEPYAYTFGDMTIGQVSTSEELGCTYTQGYWKTHSQQGPAPYEPAWANLGALEENTILDFGPTPDLTWYTAFLTAPKRGNPYFILVHQYMAAKLNVLNGASSTPEVDLALAYAENFILTYDPTFTFTQEVKDDAVEQAGILGDYNNGLTGPGHCSE